MSVYLTIQQDAAALCEYAARHWVRRCREVLQQRSVCHIALAGGSTPNMLYRRLADADFRDQVDWSRLQFYFGDERCVPHEHNESNFRMVREAMLDSLPLVPNQVHPLPYFTNAAGAADAATAAAAYQVILKRQFSAATDFPSFDLMWLGMGDDGHTASLFPGTSAVAEQRRWCTEVYVERLHSWRVSLTLPVLNKAHEVCVLVSGAAKARCLEQVLCTPQQSNKGADLLPIHLLPIQRLHPAGDLYWLLDAAAAERMSADCRATLERVA